jgi:hypothetical protein
MKWSGAWVIRGHGRVKVRVRVRDGKGLIRGDNDFISNSRPSLLSRFTTISTLVLYDYYYYNHHNNKSIVSVLKTLSHRAQFPGSRAERSNHKLTTA